MVAGSHPCLYGQAPAHDTLLLVEGEFDAILGWQRLGQRVDVATLGLGNPADHWLRYLCGYQHILLCLDNDEAGRKAIEKWRLIARTRAVAFPQGKDLTDAWAGGVDLDAWLTTALRGNVRACTVGATPTVQAAPKVPFTPAPADAAATMRDTDMNTCLVDDIFPPLTLAA
jgi:hypothetical protein